MPKYQVKGMRAFPPSDKTRERNPELFCTVAGEFYRVADNGKTEKLTIKQMQITNDQVKNPVTVIDPDSGSLILPDGKRGKRPTTGLTAKEIATAIAAARK